MHAEYQDRKRIEKQGPTETMLTPVVPVKEPAVRKRDVKAAEKLDDWAQQFESMMKS